MVLSAWPFPPICKQGIADAAQSTFSVDRQFSVFPSSASVTPSRRLWTRKRFLRLGVVTPGAPGTR
jgi:hypothetical protein